MILVPSRKCFCTKCNQFPRTYSNPEQAKTTRSLPKWTKTSRNDLKPAETTQKNWETTWNDPKFQNWGNLEFSEILIFQISSPNAQIWTFWDEKYWLSNLNEIFLVLSWRYWFQTDFCFPKFVKFHNFFDQVNYFVFWFYLNIQDRHCNFYICIFYYKTS